MINNKYVPIITGLCLVMLFGCASPRVKKLRPLTLIVIDSESKEPIEGILVLYRLRAVSIENDLLTQIIDPRPALRTVLAEKKYTNGEGKANFGGKMIHLVKGEKFNYEKIYINVNAYIQKRSDYENCCDTVAKEIDFIYRTIEFFGSPKEYVYNPNNRYDGIKILSAEFDLSAHGIEGASPYYRALENSKGLKSAIQEIIVELYPVDTQQSNAP